MAQLRIGGKTAKDANQKATSDAFALTLVRLIELARTTGRLEAQLPRMREWLQANPDHPKWRRRDRRYWQIVWERNEAVTALADCGDELARVNRQMTEATLTAWAELLGVEPTPGLVGQFVKSAKDAPSARVFDVIDTWARDHHRDNPIVNTEQCPF
jgi:hypothetical protein